MSNDTQHPDVYKTLGNLEIYPNDIGRMNWRDAIKACDGLGDGWRLPTKDELNLIYLNREYIGGNRKSLGGFSGTGDYWSSSELASGPVWFHDFYYGNQGLSYKSFVFSVRPVRKMLLMPEDGRRFADTLGTGEYISAPLGGKVKQVKQPKESTNITFQTNQSAIIKEPNDE